MDRLFGPLTTILLPIVGAILLGLLQQGYYSLLIRMGRRQTDQVPPFPILVLRGLILLIAVICILAITTWRMDQSGGSSSDPNQPVPGQPGPAGAP